MRGRTLFLFRLAVHVGAILPLLWLVWDYYNGNLSVNPYQEMTQRMGKAALVLLVLSLSATPLNTLFNFRAALKVRRALGLYAFLYALTHFFIFVGLDYGFDIALLQEEILNKNYILVGLAALIILLALAATSFRWWMKKLGRNWKRLHKFVYVAGLLVVVHYAWAVKGDVLRLQGDVLQPLLFGLLVVLLLALRISGVRRWVTRQRNKISGSLLKVRNVQSAGKPLKKEGAPR